jgi:protein-L-isoaspartate O-methyltransferase
MRTLGNVLREVSRAASGLRVRSELARLVQQDAPRPQALFRAIQQTVEGQLSRDEQLAVNRVEIVRKELELSSQELKIVDYGPNSWGGQADAATGGVVKLLSIGEIVRRQANSQLWTLLLFKLIRALRPTTCLELGTNLGVSACYQGSALLLNGQGQLVTVERDLTLAAYARCNIASLQLNNQIEVVAGGFAYVLDDVLAAHAPIDYVFIDGHYDEQSTLDRFAALKSALAPEAIVVINHIDWSPGMQRAWQTISADAGVCVAVDLLRVGVCLLGTGPRVHYRLSIGS